MSAMDLAAEKHKTTRIAFSKAFLHEYQKIKIVNDNSSGNRLRISITYRRMSPAADESFHASSAALSEDSSE